MPFECRLPSGATSWSRVVRVLAAERLGLQWDSAVRLIWSRLLPEHQPDPCRESIDRRVSGRRHTSRMMSRGRAAAAVIAVLAAACAAGGQPRYGPSGVTPRPIEQQRAVSANANVCGSWSGAGNAIARSKGEPRNCIKDRSVWLIFTLAPEGQHSRTSGAAGIDSCGTDAACLEGTDPHPMNDWTWVKPPFPGM
jgi:hypothetical protein